ncbi:PSF1 [Malassezia furfur]|nr:PSF1 [Malassezia furfur]
MPGEEALALVHEAKLSRATGALRPYNAELVRLVQLETRQLHQQLVPLADAARAQSAHGGARADPALAAQLVALHLQAYRNKRCLLVYHAERLAWLKQRVWDKAGALALVLDEEAHAGADVVSLRPLLSHAELEWLRAYTGLLGLYKDTYLDVLDVTLPSRRAPRTHAPTRRTALAPAPAAAVYAATTPPNALRAPDDLMITVLVTRDAPNVETERGTIQLRAGERLHVRRDEVEGLLLRGWVRQVDA